MYMLIKHANSSKRNFHLIYQIDINYYANSTISLFFSESISCIYTHRTNSASLSRHRHAAWNSRYIRNNTGTWAPPVRLSETTPWCDQTHAPPPWRNRSWCFPLRHQTPSFPRHQSGHRHWMGKKHARVLYLKVVKHGLEKFLSLRNYFSIKFEQLQIEKKALKF